MDDTSLSLRLLEERRYIELLYFGLVNLVRSPTAEVHLALGVACCACCKPLAEWMREFHPTPEQAKNPQIARVALKVTRDTRLVNEGLHHLLAATTLSPDLRLPSHFEPMTRDILSDLRDYAREDFRDVGSQRELGYSFNSAGWAAIVLLARIQGINSAEYLPDIRIKAGNELLETLASSKPKTAAFYQVLPQ